MIKEIIKPLAKCFGERYPETLVKIRYLFRFHKFLNLNNPQTLNEKILYLSLRTDTSLWTTLADKNDVRDYVESVGLGNILVKKYGVWDSVDTISFESLPKSFVLKTTHGCGDVLIVKNKNEINKDQVKKTFRELLSHSYGPLEGGKHYMRIKPRLIAEELLPNDLPSLQYSNSLIDYKIWCFNGEPQFIMTCTNRKKHSLDLLVYDTQWNIVDEAIHQDSVHHKGQPIPKPSLLNEMLDAAKKLARPFPCVRVDLYFLNNKIYFGEMTFTSLGGLMNYYTPEFLLKSGQMIDLDYTINKK